MQIKWIIYSQFCKGIQSIITPLFIVLRLDSIALVCKEITSRHTHTQTHTLCVCLIYIYIYICNDWWYINLYALLKLHVPTRSVNLKWIWFNKIWIIKYSFIDFLINALNAFFCLSWIVSLHEVCQHYWSMCCTC